MVKNLPSVQETKEARVQSLGQEDPLEEDMETHSSIHGEFHRHLSPEGYSPWGCKESDMTE